jgi:hypothetical protein
MPFLRTLRVVLAGEVFAAALKPEAPPTVAAFVKLLPTTRPTTQPRAAKGQGASHCQG